MIDLLQAWIFALDLISLYILLVGISLSVLVPAKRIWPPLKKKSWQYVLSWSFYSFSFVANGSLMILDWNEWIMTGIYRFFIAGPLVVIGGTLFSWGMKTLGKKSTSGLKNQLITDGPYRFTRNPQYLGGIILFMGIVILANSLQVLVTHVLLSLVFCIAPLAEEPWLEENYGEAYKKYKGQTPRFL